MRKLSIIFLLIGCSLGKLEAQELISVSGIVIDANETVAIPYVNIQVHRTGIGASTAKNGFFSIVAKKTDTLLFSSVGYRRQMLVIPDTVNRSRWSVIVEMKRDTVQLEETVVYPWPTPSKFKQAFLALEVSEPKIQTGYFPPGIIRKLDTIIPVRPNPIMNPASFIYEEVVLEVIKRLPKRKRARDLPKFE